MFGELQQFIKICQPQIRQILFSENFEGTSTFTVVNLGAVLENVSGSQWINYIGTSPYSYTGSRCI